MADNKDNVNINQHLFQAYLSKTGRHTDKPQLQRSLAIENNKYTFIKYVENAEIYFTLCIGIERERKMMVKLI